MQAVFDALPVGHKARLQATVEKLFIDNLPIGDGEVPSILPVIERLAVRLGRASDRSDTAIAISARRPAWIPLSDLGSPLIGNLDDALIEIAKLRAENNELRAKLGRPKGTKKKGDGWYLRLGLVAEDLKQQGMKDHEIADKLREEVPLNGIPEWMRRR